MAKQLSRIERETFLRINDATKNWEFFTLSPVWAKRMEKRGYQLEKDNQGGWSCTLPIGKVSVRRQGDVVKREISSEKAEIMRQRLADARSRRFSQTSQSTN
jgi:hypothetical protein